MQKGDLSNEAPSRFYFVFEGLLGRQTHPWSKTQEATYIALRQWKAAVGTWDLSEQMLAHVWDVTWRHHMSLDVVTFKPAGFALALEERFDREHLPIGSVVRFDSPNDLAKRMAYLPQVMTVFFGNPEWEFRFGSRGRLIRNNGVGFSPWV